MSLLPCYAIQPSLVPLAHLSCVLPHQCLAGGRESSSEALMGLTADAEITYSPP